MNVKSSYLRGVLSRASLVAVLALLFVGSAAGHSTTRADSIGSGNGNGNGNGNDNGNATGKYQTKDHYVAHISTVPVNAGQLVHLFVREVRLQDEQGQNGDDGNNEGEHADKPRVVLMAGGGTQPAMASFNLAFKDYNWMETLADAGFDVFALDFTGYGFSPRPTMDNPCNASLADQRLLLIPNPLAATCPPTYPFKLTSRETDRAELNTVVDYIRELRGVDRVDLIGWSRGARIGRFAALNPEKVGRLFLYAPEYNPTEADVGSLPEPGVPLLVRTISSFIAGWNAQAKCPNEIDPEIRAPLAATIMSFDPVGQTWGTQPLWRAPNQTLTGWNRAVVSRITAPTLLIGGENDATVLPASVRSLYTDLPVAEKVLVHVACAAHQMVWEKQHTVLQRASVEWLRNGTFAGQTNGVFAVDTAGIATREP